jgi:mannose-1-phosphate guanylyltransferase
MRAMILAAGLATRLRPLTLVRPKVLVPVAGSCALDFWVWSFYRAGFEAVAVNGFHLHEKLIREVQARQWPIPVHVLAEPILLGTGGGIRNALDFLGSEPFAVVNGDILCTLPLRELYERHVASGCGASLVIHDWPVFNNVAVSPEGSILGFGEEAKGMARGGSGARLLAFTGIHFLNAQVLEGLPAGVFSDILSIYRKHIGEGRALRALFADNLFWREMGSLEAYRGLHRELTRLQAGSLAPLRTGESVCIQPGARIAPGARLKGYVSIGDGCCVGENATLEDTILWDGVRVGPEARLCNCIVTDGLSVEGDHRDEILSGVGP